MTSNKPYLIRAIYDWISDNLCTPYLLVNTAILGCEVPEQHIAKDNSIVLNIASDVVEHLELSNEGIAFSARFSGVSTEIYIPITAVAAIYAKESGEGLSFNIDLSENQNNDPLLPPRRKNKGKPNLKIVK